MNRIILIRGVPGTGKSTLANLISDNVYETDDFFVDSQGNYNFDPKLLSTYNRLNQIRVRQSINAGDDTIVVSNTFSEVWEMEPFINMALVANYKIIVIALVGLHPNIHDVPQTTVDAMTERWESYPGEHIYEAAGKTPYRRETTKVTNQVE